MCATMVMHAGNVCSYLIAVERDNGAKKLLLHQNEVREVEIYLIRTFTFHTPDEDDAPTTMKAPAGGEMGKEGLHRTVNEQLKNVSWRFFKQ